MVGLEFILNHLILKKFRGVELFPDKIAIFNRLIKQRIDQEILLRIGDPSW
jgi:hypothetical protein